MAFPKVVPAAHLFGGEYEGPGGVDFDDFSLQPAEGLSPTVGVFPLGQEIADPLYMFDASREAFYLFNDVGGKKKKIKQG